jgi:DNA-binding XRE family transcriptional regulator
MWPVEWSVNVHPIERERLRRGWTRTELARVAHVDPRTVCSLVVGRRRPSLGTVQALCTALRLPLSDVIVIGDRQPIEGAGRDQETDRSPQLQEADATERPAANDVRARRSLQRRVWARESSHWQPRT